MKIRLAKKIWKASERSLFPNRKDYWAIKWNIVQFYKGVIYDHRLGKAARIMVKLIIKENEKDINNGNNSQMS